jgi:hypothetical protein
VSCGCGGKTGTRIDGRTEKADDLQPMFEVLGHQGFREIGEQTFRAVDTMATAIRHLDKADRAAALGFGEDVVRQHRDAAVRWNRQAQQQFRTVIERIDDRTNQDDWAELVERFRTEFMNRNGPQQIQDLAAEAKQVLLDTDRLNGSDAAECAATIDRGTDVLIERGFPGIVGELRSAAESGLQATQHPEMGRQPASPISTARAVCIATAWGVALVAFGICLLVYLCWCCAWPFIALALGIATTACAFID